MLKIYHVPGTRSVRVIWLCEELQLPYEIETISFSAEYRSSSQWRKLNPVGKVPVMSDGELTLFESGAMVQYLLDRYGEGRLQPAAGTHKHGLYLQWCWFAEATFARPLGEIVNHRRAFTEAEQSPRAIEEMQTRARLCMKAVHEAMEGKEYIVGEFSAADIMLGYSLMLCEKFAATDDYSNASSYWQRLKARQACKIAQSA